MIFHAASRRDFYSIYVRYSFSKVRRTAATNIFGLAKCPRNYKHLNGHKNVLTAKSSFARRRSIRQYLNYLLRVSLIRPFFYPYFFGRRTNGSYKVFHIEIITRTGGRPVEVRCRSFLRSMFEGLQVVSFPKY